MQGQDEEPLNHLRIKLEIVARREVLVMLESSRSDSKSLQQRRSSSHIRTPRVQSCSKPDRPDCSHCRDLWFTEFPRSHESQNPLPAQDLTFSVPCFPSFPENCLIGPRILRVEHAAIS